MGLLGAVGLQVAAGEEGLDCAAGEEVGGEGEPQGVVAEAGEKEEVDEEV